MSRSTRPTRKGLAYPEPFVVPALLQPHKQIIILLHGRGSNAERFGPLLLTEQIPVYGNLQDAFPHAKFVFPTACKRRATIYKRSIINQWFDNWVLSEPREREELQIDGLRETSAFVHELVKAAVEEVGERNVVLGGLSQGCAATLVSLILWEGKALAAAVGMCGWLPFCAMIDEAAKHNDLNGDWEFSNEDDDIFERDKKGDEDPVPIEQGMKGHTESTTVCNNQGSRAVSWLRAELELGAQEKTSTSSSLPFQEIPLFLGHGVEDEKVFFHLGREAADCLEALKMKVCWREYQGLGHWYSGEMLHDLVVFLRENTGWCSNAA